MRQRVVLSCTALLLVLLQGFYQEVNACSVAACGDDRAKESAANCRAYTNDEGVKPCCWNAKDKDCRLDITKAMGLQFSRSSGGIDSQIKETAVKLKYDKIPRVGEEEFKELAKDIPAKASEGYSEQNKNKFRRSLSLGNIGPAILGGASSFFVQCPVSVKYCYRTPCGGPGAENDASICLSNPQCCFDFKTAFYKRAFGPRFFGNSPNCYYGPTSKLWTYLTNSLQPYNPFYGQFILKYFGEFIKTNLLDIGGKFACSVDFQKRALPVGEKSEIECNLVNGCWDEDKPQGSRCAMTSSLVDSFFGGGKKLYPFLYTNDPADTQCSANWFEFGPKAYTRLPCGIGPAPSKIFDKIFWCPSQDCCLNYATALSDPTDLISLQVLSAGGGGGLFGGGFSPSGSGVTAFDSSAFQYLFLSKNLAGSSSLNDLFCPYNILLSSDLFSDLAENAIGCCTIPDCYHKKQFASNYRPPTRPRPPIVPRPPVQPQPQLGRWGPFGRCTAVQCGQQGQRYRTCYYGNTEAPGACSGQSSEPCFGECPQYGVWSRWTVKTNCPRCGDGYATYERVCYVNSQPASPSQCSGSPTEQRRCENNPPCQTYRYGPYEQLYSCQVRCGSGTTTFGPKKCYNNLNQEVRLEMCPQPRPTRQGSCQGPPCQERAVWSNWQDDGGCAGTCGYILKKQKRRCQFPSGASAPPALCGGTSADLEKFVQCDLPQCPYYYHNVCRRDSQGGCVLNSYCYQQTSDGYQQASQSVCPTQIRRVNCNEC